MARHNLTEAVGYADKRLVDIFSAYTTGIQQAPVRGPLETLFDCIAPHCSTPHKNLNQHNDNHLTKSLETPILTAWINKTNKIQLFLLKQRL
jgi:hypothetical protein